MAAYQKESDGFPIAPLDPLEEVYYALGELKDTVSADRLSLLVTTTATAWDSEGDRTGTLSGEELQELLEKRGTTRYYSTATPAPISPPMPKTPGWCGSWTRRPWQNGPSSQSSSGSASSA